jgi:hypothetical protein
MVCIYNPTHKRFDSKGEIVAVCRHKRSNAAALRGFKAAVTQKLNKAEKRGATVDDAANPTARAVEDLQASIDDIEAQADRFNEFFQRVIESEDDEQAAQTWIDEQMA